MQSPGVVVEDVGGKYAGGRCRNKSWDANKAGIIRFSRADSPFNESGGTMKEILRKLTEKHKTQTDSCEEELYDTLKELGASQIANNLNVSKHRWYETSTTVFELQVGGETKYLGVNCATGIFSEESSFSDLCCSYSFFEMRKIMKPAFEKIKG